LHYWYIHLAVEDDSQCQSAEVFVTVHRENNIDQNTIQHCHPEVGNCMPPSVRLR